MGQDSLSFERMVNGEVYKMDLKVQNSRCGKFPNRRN